MELGLSIEEYKAVYNMMRDASGLLGCEECCYDGPDPDIPNNCCGVDCLVGHAMWISQLKEKIDTGEIK